MKNEIVQSKEKLMSTKEIADVFHVDVKSIQRTCKYLADTVPGFPKFKQGQTGLYNEAQVALISKERKNPYKVVQLTSTPGVEASKSTTELEVLANAAKALLDLQNLFNQKEAEYKAIIAAKDNELKEVKPLADGYQVFLASHNSFSMQEASSMLKDSNGKSPFGRNTFIEKLRDEKIFLSRPKPAIPYREYIDRGYFEVKTTVINGHSYTSTLVFPKGLDFLAKKFGLIVEYNNL